jgi:endonuclease YncB( thermonuclease family)
MFRQAPGPGELLASSGRRTLPGMNKLHRTFAAALAAIAALSTPASHARAPSDVLEGIVVHVEDGDTLTLLDTRKVPTTIRLADIDAPETCHSQHDPSCRRRPGQPFGDKARIALASLTKGHQVVATCRGAVRAGRDERQVCFVNVDHRGPAAQSVNYEMVRRGLAWVEPRFAKDPQLYDLADAAKRQRVGLWSMPNQIEPRMWRSACWTQGNCPN